jgi:conjugative transfer signal peptidase TraF
MHREVKRFFAIATACLAIFTVTAVVAWHFGFRYNDTASFPVGIWRLTPGLPKKGDLVFFRPPEQNPAIQWGHEVGILTRQFGGLATMIKRIVAVTGDRIDVSDTISVNGQQLVNSRIYRHDQAGRSIPSLATSGIVPPGKVWLMSDFAVMSFDSRYFGPVEQTAILGLAHPVWTW